MRVMGGFAIVTRPVPVRLRVASRAGHTSRALLLSAAALTALTACTQGQTSVVPTAPPASAAAGPVFGGVDWSKHVRSCAVDSGGSGLRTLIDDVIQSDVTSDGQAEWLVVDECESSTSRWPQQIEVFTPGPGAPTRLGTLLADDPAYPRDLTVTVEDTGRVRVTGRGLSADAPLCCPDLEIRRVFAWTSDGFTVVESVDTPS
jgi:hypothetical protein